jgi:uncharacterized membrane protein YgcG
MAMVPASLAQLPAQLVIIVVLVCCVSYRNCDTIHFTNSPSYLITKKNFSTYKLDVPGSEPITIFEESKKFSKRTNQYAVPPPTFVTSKKQVTAYQDDEDEDSRFPYERPQVQYGGGEDNQHMISRFGSVERLQDKNVHVSASLPMTIISPDTPPASPYSSDSPAITQNNGDDFDEDGVSKTTVYSPVLLDKFLKDYAHKLKNADAFTKEKLYEIAKITENKQLPKPIEPSPASVDRNDNTASDDKSQQQKKSYAHNRPYGGGSSGGGGYGGGNSGGGGTNGGWVSTRAFFSI